MFDSFRHLAGDRTVIFFDLRNRGNSDSVGDREKLARGIHQDVDDIETVRQYFGIDKVDMIGHSYVGLMVILYAMKYPAHVNRIVQIGPSQPNAATRYPAHLTGADAMLAEFAGKVAQLRQAPPPTDPKTACEEFWALVRTIMVANPADADKIQWTPCDSPGESGFMKHWTVNVQPSIQRLHLTDEELLKVSAPVLTIHGTRDRQAPYGGGRAWALKLPDARLIAVENAAHVPWIEAPEKVFGAIQTFLDGAAQVVDALNPRTLL
jgi:proline iminopeptidase